MLLLFLLLEDAKNASALDKAMFGKKAEEIRLAKRLTASEAADVVGYASALSWNKAVSSGSFERFRLNRFKLFTCSHEKLELVYRSTGGVYQFDRTRLAIGPTFAPNPALIAAARLQAGLTQAQACLLSEIKHTSSWSLLESGTRKYTNEVVSMDPVRFEWFTLATNTHPDFSLRERELIDDANQPAGFSDVRLNNEQPSADNPDSERHDSSVALLRKKQALNIIKQALEEDQWTVEQLLHALDSKSFAAPSHGALELNSSRMERLELYKETIEDEALELTMLLPRRAPRVTKITDKRRGAKKRAGDDKRSNVDAMYRGPDGQTWSGRGSMPIWLRDALSDGTAKSKADFFIKSPVANRED